jgi:hypothetical protein
MNASERTRLGRSSAPECTSQTARNERTAGPNRLRIAFLALVLAGAWALGTVGAQEAPGAPDGSVSGVVDEVPAVAAFGVAFGFPAYRTAGLGASLQAGAFGAAVRAAWGSAGIAVGLQARAYPPVPWPVPTYVAAGADLYGGSVAPHLAVGAHVPLAERWRLDVEGGVAWPPLLDARPLAPYLSLGVGYAFALTIAPSTSTVPAPVAAGAGTAEACLAGPPDAALLNAAVDATVRRFVADATATYGSLYRGLDYRVRVVERDVQGDQARLEVAYEGSVVERATGRTIEASGTAEVTFQWRGCGWVRTGLTY